MVNMATSCSARVPVSSERTAIRSALARKTARSVAAGAGKKDQGPMEAPKAVMNALGALAAVQLAFGGVANADVEQLLPDSATSSTARAAVNKETSDAPSFKDIGSSLSKQFNTDDPKEVGRALNRATPDVDLTKNPKELLDNAGKKAQEAVSNISELNNPFAKGKGGIPLGADLEKLRSEAAKTAGAPTTGGVKKVADKAKDLGKAASKTGPGAPTKNEAVGQLSYSGQQDDLGSNPLNPFELSIDKYKTPRPEEQEAKAKVAALDAKLDPQGASSSGPTATGSGSVGSAAAAKGEQAREAARNVRAASGDISLSNPFASEPEKAGQEAKSAAKDVARDAGKLANKVPGPSELGDAAKAKAKEAGRAVQQVTGNVSLSNPFASGPEKAGQEAQSAAKDVARDAGKVANKVPGPSELGDAAKAKAKEAGRAVQQVTGNISEGSIQDKFAAGPQKEPIVSVSKSDAKNLASDVGSAAGDVKDKAADAAKKVQNIAGNLSLSNPFASGPEKAGQEAQSAAKDAAREAGKVANKVPGPSELGDAAKAKAKEAGRAVQQVTGNVSLSNPFASEPEKAGQEAKSAAKDVVRDAGKVANKVPGPSELGDAAKAKAKEAGRAVQQVTGNVSLSNPFASEPEKAGQEAKSAAKDVARDAGKLANKVPGPSELGDAAKAKGKEASRAVQQVTGNLSLGIPDELKGAPPTQTGPSVTTKSEGLGRALDVKDADAEQSRFPSPVEFQKIDRTEAQAAAEKATGDAAGNLPTPQEIGKSIPSAGEIKDKLPNVGLPSPAEAFNKAKSAAGL